MGSQLHLVSYGETERSGLSRELVRSLFPIDQGRSNADCWTIQYDSLNGCSIYVGPHETNSQTLINLWFERPCRDIRLWDAIYAVLDMGSVVLIYPSSSLILVAKGVCVQDIPTKLIGGRDSVAQVESTREMLDVLGLL